MNSRFAMFLSLSIGLLLPFAFAPYEFRFLAWILPAGLFLLWQNLETRQIYWSGLFYQLGFFASGVHWVFYSIHLFGNAAAPLAALVTVLFIVSLAFISSIFAFVYAQLAQNRSVVESAFVFSATWVGIEWLRSWLFGGFPWLALGYSQVDTWFAAYAPLFGVYGISALLVLVSTLLVVIALDARNIARIFAVVVSGCIVGGAFWLVPIQWTQEKEQSLRVRMVQGNIKQQVKFEKNALKTSLDLYTKLSTPTADEEIPDVVIWPETAIPTLYYRVEGVLVPFIERMQQLGIDVLSGGFTIDKKDQVYNAFFKLTNAQQVYLKSHLVPFGEFMPFRFILDFLAEFIDIPMSDLSAGPTNQNLISVKDEKIGISICYEDAFGTEMRPQLPTATLLVNVSNDTWFGDSAAPAQHQEIAAMRAREFGRPLIRVTNTGISAFISSNGEVQEGIPQFEEGYLDKRIFPRIGATPFVYLGDWPVIVFFTLVFLFAGVSKRITNNVKNV